MPEARLKRTRKAYDVGPQQRTVYYDPHEKGAFNRAYRHLLSLVPANALEIKLELPAEQLYRIVKHLPKGGRRIEGLIRDPENYCNFIMAGRLDIKYVA